MRFIQISDIHFQYKNFQSERLRQKFIEKIVEIHKLNPIDAILITGDIIHQGDKNTAESLEFIERIVEAIGLDISKLFLTPGNHDLSRDEVCNMFLAGIFAQSNPSEALDQIEDKSYKMLLNTHDVFLKNFEQIKGEAYTEDNLHRVYISEEYNIINLNTSLTCYKAEQEGHLLISKKKFNNILEEYRGNLLDTDKINIAIGHHTLDCLHPQEKQDVINLFDDFNIDIYLAGHVHKPKYYFTNNSDFPFVELTSGSLFSDDYAKPGFMCLDINSADYSCSSTFYIWNEEFNYWAINNQIGRRSVDGSIKFELSRLKKKNEFAELLEHNLIRDDNLIDEDEFKEFIIQFHNSVEKRQTFIMDTDKRIELDEKFLKMKCSPTFIKEFDKSSLYFGSIDEIMNSTSYVSTDKKDLVADVIIEHYLDIHSEYENGDKIFVNIIRLITQSYISKFSDYTELTLKRYIKILISWSIFECNIFNDEKVDVIN